MHQALAVLYIKCIYKQPYIIHKGLGAKLFKYLNLILQVTIILLQALKVHFYSPAIRRMVEGH